MLRSVRGESYFPAALWNFGRVMPADAAIQSKIMWRVRARIHEPLRHNLASAFSFLREMWEGTY